jgi:hypothetical protein
MGGSGATAHVAVFAAMGFAVLLANGHFLQQQKPPESPGHDCVTT